MHDTRPYFLVDITLITEIGPDLLEKQRAFLARLTEEAHLVLAGVIPDIKGRGLAILRAGSLDQAKEIYAHAPVVESGKATVKINSIRITAGLLHSS